MVAEITAEGLAVMTEATDPRLGKAALKAPLEPSEGGEMRTEDAQLVPLVESKKIMQPFGDRSGVVIEPMLTDQWFVDAAKVVGPALDAVRTGRTKIIPESGEKVFLFEKKILKFTEFFFIFFKKDGNNVDQHVGILSSYFL